MSMLNKAFIHSCMRDWNNLYALNVCIVYNDKVPDECKEHHQLMNGHSLMMDTHTCIVAHNLIVKQV